MRLLRRSLERLKGKRLLNDLFEAEGDSERMSLYRRRWDTPAWRIFTRMFLSRRMMSYLFTEDFFRYVEGTFSFGDHFARKVEHALTQMPLRDNYFASYILLGRYLDEDHLPPYLMRDNFPVIRSRLDRVQMITGTCGEFFAQREESSIQKFNFTNIFEWMSPREFEEIMRAVWCAGSHGAVMTYRNLLVRRERPRAFEGMLAPDRPLAEYLHARDRSFIYRAYVVERIIKRETQWSTGSEKLMTAAR